MTEVATALGCVGSPNLDWALLQRPEIVGVGGAEWRQIDGEVVAATSRRIALSAFENGATFLAHDEGLRGRLPRLVEWTGGRRPPGDQAVPADLRLDHVYIISCKYLSKIVLNTAPARLFEQLLQPGSIRGKADWYDAVAPNEHRQFAREACGAFDVAAGQDVLSPAARAELKRSFGRHARLEGDVAAAYRELCTAVSTRSAAIWATSLQQRGRRSSEDLLWRMLRMASGTYYVLGVSREGASLRLRVMTPWDWRQAFELRRFDIEPADAGQPQVKWVATVRDLAADVERGVEGHVEVRWSHGRFGGPPEAKVYLDTPHAQVPGYVALV